MEFMSSNWFTWVVAIIVVGSFIAIISESFDIDTSDLWAMSKKILLFVPLLLVGIVLYVLGDFKNHRLGYISIFFLVAFISFGFYMGLKAGPSSPAPWQ